MCVAELNVSLNSCQHRWYHLVRPCIPGGNLLSCPSKLALEGWEIKCDFCPFCAGWPLSGGEFLMLGSQPHSRSSSFSSPLSRTPSLTTSVAVARRDSRRASFARTDSTASFHAINGAVLGSPVYAASERNRAMNYRVDSYFSALPETVLETQSKRPGGSGPMWPSWTANADDEGDDDDRRGSASTSSSISATATAKVEAVAGKAGKAWRKAKRRSQDLTKFFR